MITLGWGCLKWSLQGISEGLVTFCFLIYILVKFAKIYQAVCLRSAHFLCVYYTSIPNLKVIFIIFVPLAKHLKISVTKYRYIIELKTVFGNPGQWLCKMTVIRGMKTHPFNVLNSALLNYGYCQTIPQEKTKKKM